MFRRWKIGICVAGMAIAAWFTRRIWIYAATILLGGAMIALIVNPVVRALERRMSRPMAVFCAWTGVALLLALLLLTLFLPLAARCRSMNWHWTDCVDCMRRLFPALNDSDWSASEIAQLAQQCVDAIRQLKDGVMRVTDVCSRVALMAIVSIFLLLDRERYTLRAELVLPLRWRRVALTVASQIGRELSLFLRGQALVGLCVGGLSALGLACIGVDGSLPAGILVGAFNLIPYFGPVLGAVPVALFAWNDGFAKVLLALGVLVAVQQLDNMWISPGIMSSVTGLSPLSVLLAMAVGGAVLGIFGMVIAIPAAIAIRIVARYAVQHNRHL